MCTLAVTQFTRQSLQMYKATKQWQSNRFVNLLVIEGVLYFLWYVPSPVFDLGTNGCIASWGGTS